MRRAASGVGAYEEMRSGAVSWLKEPVWGASWTVPVAGGAGVVTKGNAGGLFTCRRSPVGCPGEGVMRANFRKYLIFTVELEFYCSPEMYLNFWEAHVPDLGESRPAAWTLLEQKVNS